MRILIIKTSSFGDIIHALPVATAIKKYYPYSHITWQVKPQYTELISDYPDINSVNPEQHKYYDHILDLQGLMKTAALAKLQKVKSKANKTEIIGFHKPREILAKYLYDKKITTDKSTHIVNQNLEILKGLEIYESVEPAWNMPDYSRPGITDSPYIVITKQTTWKSKYWKHKHWDMLLQKLYVQYPGHKVIILGSEKDTIHAPLDNIINLTGQTTLTELKNIIAHASLCIAPDTGILHLAQAYSIPSIALMGATSPYRTGIIHSNNSMNITCSTQLDCMPCHKRNCKNKIYNQCMDEITVESVFRGVQELLN